jgi:hypothetical protein
LEVRAALRAAVRLHREVVVPSVILAEDLGRLAASYGNVMVIGLP